METGSGRTAGRLLSACPAIARHAAHERIRHGSCRFLRARWLSPPRPPSSIRRGCASRRRRPERTLAPPLVPARSTAIDNRPDATAAPLAGESAAAGATMDVKLGDRVERGQPLFRLDGQRRGRPGVRQRLCRGRSCRSPSDRFAPCRTSTPSPQSRWPAHPLWRAANVPQPTSSSAEDHGGGRWLAPVCIRVQAVLAGDALHVLLAADAQRVVTFHTLPHATYAHRRACRVRGWSAAAIGGYAKGPEGPCRSRRAQ